MRIYYLVLVNVLLGAAQAGAEGKLRARNLGRNFLDAFGLSNPVVWSQIIDTAVPSVAPSHVAVAESSLATSHNAQPDTLEAAFSDAPTSTPSSFPSPAPFSVSSTAPSVAQLPPCQTKNKRCKRSVDCCIGLKCKSKKCVQAESLFYHKF